MFSKSEDSRVCRTDSEVDSFCNSFTHTCVNNMDRSDDGFIEALL